MRNSIFERGIKRKICCHAMAGPTYPSFPFIPPISFYLLYFLLSPLPLSATQSISPLVAVDDLHAFMVGDLAWSF